MEGRTVEDDDDDRPGAPQATAEQGNYEMVGTTSQFGR
jgi:hypothetical protein